MQARVTKQSSTNDDVERVLRKTESGDWDEDLTSSTQKVNCRIIHHLHMAPSTILLGLDLSTAPSDANLAFIPPEGTLSWVDQVTEPIKFSRAVREYCNYPADLIR